VTAGVAAARAKGAQVDHKILSARHGLVDGTTELAPYDEVLTPARIPEWQTRTSADRELRTLLERGGYDLVVISLPPLYRRAAGLDDIGSAASPTIMLAPPGDRPAERQGNLHIGLAGRPVARALGCSDRESRDRLAAEILVAAASGRRLEADLARLAGLEAAITTAETEDVSGWLAAAVGGDSRAGALMRRIGYTDEQIAFVLGPVVAHGRMIERRNGLSEPPAWIVSRVRAERAGLVAVEGPGGGPGPTPPLARARPPVGPFEIVATLWPYVLGGGPLGRAHHQLYLWASSHVLAENAGGQEGF
jgi:hypothetical protein